jgi:hypothetical protein
VKKESSVGKKEIMYANIIRAPKARICAASRVEELEVHCFAVERGFKLVEDISAEERVWAFGAYDFDHLEFEVVKLEIYKVGVFPFLSSVKRCNE